MSKANGFQVRDARPSDLNVVVDFNFRLAQETEGKTLDRAVLAKGVGLALAEPDRLRYWVAESSTDGVVIGQAAISREWTDWRFGWLWWLQSVYVAQEYRGSGVFRSIYEHIRELARNANDVIGLRLYVEHENDAAQATYQRLGMKPGGYHVFEELWPDRITAHRD